MKSDVEVYKRVWVEAGLAGLKESVIDSRALNSLIFSKYSSALLAKHLLQEQTICSNTYNSYAQYAEKVVKISETKTYHMWKNVMPVAPD